MKPIIKTFSTQVSTNNIYKNKTACFELHDCIIDLREFGKHPEYEQSLNLKVYSDNRRIKKYINRNPETNALWYVEDVPTYDIEDTITDLSDVIVDQEISELFFCYDYLEWQYSHFLTDVYPKMWYYPKLKDNFPDLKFGQIRPIVNFAYNLNDKTLNTKLNIVSDFAHQITDFYLKYNSCEKDFFALEIGKVYKINKLFIPVPFTSQDVVEWPDVQMEMYELLIKESNKVVTEQFPKKVFISRNDTIKNGWFNLRHCINESYISNALIPLGYEVIELMSLNIFEKIKVFSSADEIVQLVGSNCFNTVFVRPNTKIFTILHPYYTGWSSMLDHLARMRDAKFIPFNENIEILGLEGYPDNYKKIPDQPWRLTDVNPLMKLISKETE